MFLFSEGILPIKSSNHIQENLNAFIPNQQKQRGFSDADRQWLSGKVSDETASLHHN